MKKQKKTSHDGRTNIHPNGMPATILLVTDDLEIQAQLKKSLLSEFLVLEADIRANAVDILQREKPEIVLYDAGLVQDSDVRSDGLAPLRHMLQVVPSLKVIVMVGRGDRTTALAVIEEGAYDCIEKPIELETLKVMLHRAAYISGVEEEVRALREQNRTSQFEGIIGSSGSMRDVFDMIGRVAKSTVPVLITGESGTGKELIARAIHDRSIFSRGAFVPIDCAAVREQVLEAKLFGHDRGSSIGADRQRQSKPEVNPGGTLFLDEVGRLSLRLQTKLLRFLQGERLERDAARIPNEVNTRILASTNDDLRACAEKGSFREDLFYRLSLVQIAVPPLRQREGDLVLLAQAFLNEYRRVHDGQASRFSKEALDAISTYGWPGNVSELKYRLKRAVTMTKRPVIEPEDLELPRDETIKGVRKLKEARAQVEIDLVQQALCLQNGNISRAAKSLGISRQALHGLILKHGLGSARITKPWNA